MSAGYQIMLYVVILTCLPQLSKQLKFTRNPYERSRYERIYTVNDMLFTLLHVAQKNELL